jgi:hypothetical protein
MRVTHLITFRKSGNSSKKTLKFTWIISVGLQLIGNAIIAGIFKNTPGYGSDFTVTQLTFFYAARPRFAWIVLGFLAMRPWKADPETLRKVYTENVRKADPGTEMSALEATYKYDWTNQNGMLECEIAAMNGNTY